MLLPATVDLYCIWLFPLLQTCLCLIRFPSPSASCLSHFKRSSLHFSFRSSLHFMISSFVPRFTVFFFPRFIIHPSSKRKSAPRLEPSSLRVAIFYADRQTTPLPFKLFTLIKVPNFHARIYPDAKSLGQLLKSNVKYVYVRPSKDFTFKSTFL